MIRRLVDILVAVPVILVLLVPGLLVALAIRLDSPGNPIYGGVRVGRGGRPFRMWKFRTMVRDADRLGPGITARSDARVTRLGRWLRSTKVDEFPQFINLLCGQLTLVGPRAEVPDIVERYTEEQREVLQAKPGITGPGQLYYTTDQEVTMPEGVSPDDFYVDHLLGPKLAIDLEFLQHRTVFSDLKIVVDTVRYMVRSLFR